MKKIFVSILLTVFIVHNHSQAQNVGIGVTNPAAKLDVAGNIKIADGTQAAGRILTTDANGLASWAPRKKPRVVRITDPNTGCLIVHTPIYNYAFALTDTSDYTITGKSIRYGTGRHDINLLVDGATVQIVLTYTPVAEGAQWAEAVFTYGGNFLPGAHTIQVLPVDNSVPWGCGNLYGNMIVTFFD